MNIFLSFVLVSSYFCLFALTFRRLVVSSLCLSTTTVWFKGSIYIELGRSKKKKKCAFGTFIRLGFFVVSISVIDWTKVLQTIHSQVWMKCAKLRIAHSFRRVSTIYTDIDFNLRASIRLCWNLCRDRYVSDVWEDVFPVVTSQLTAKELLFFLWRMN